MPIRFATLEDISALVALGKTMHELTRFKSFDYNEIKMADVLKLVIENKQQRHVLFVAETHERKIVGAMLAVLEKHIFSDKNVLSIMDYIVHPSNRMGGHGLRLLLALEQWAKNRKIAEVSFGINSREGMEKVSSFAKKMKYEKVGENFLKTFI